MNAPHPTAVVLLSAALACTAPQGGGDAGDGPGGQGPGPPFEQATRGLERLPGLFELFLDRDEGRVLAVLPAPDATGLSAECLYLEGIATGLGSNPVGLDRGQHGGARVVRFRRVGDKVLLEEPNLAFRARSADPAEVRAVEQSFATSVLWGGAVLARADDGLLLVDLTPFVVRDAHGSAETLERAGEGSWSVDPARSALDPAAVLAFPDNVELEALLTFAGSQPGAQVRATAPDARSVTLVQHHSFVRLPGPGYRPRVFDPRSGSSALRFLDYAAPLSRPLEVLWARRHRLAPLDAGAPSSAPVEPIVYHVDPGCPEPVRSALVEGASWWDQAFQAAGYDGAFRVELLPPDAHPLDVRYNVIQWVHRATRGWSYGNSIDDPRTGEIIKGHVSLGSLRVRQDRLLFEGLAGVEKTDSGGPDDPIQLALARIRQLAAHEVGHTLGFAHNFSASTTGRASVMDYPAPLVRVGVTGELDFSDAYAVGIGAWDEIAVGWLYGDFAPGTERASLEHILADAAARGLRYHTDADARPPGAAHPYASLWDNGPDPVAGLRDALAVRRVALERFGVPNLPAGEPLAKLQEVFAPLYMYHRYQLDAALKMVGGVDYDYTVNGYAVLGAGGLDTARPVAARDQERALIGVLDFLRPENLDVPETVLERLLPRPPGYGPNRELFEARTGVVFDALGAAETAAEQAVGGLLHRERCARLVDQHRRDAALPALEDVLEGLCGAAFADLPQEPRLAEVQRVMQGVVVRELLALARSRAASAQVTGRVEARLEALLVEIVPTGDEPPEHRAHLAALAAAVRRHLAREDPEDEGLPAAPEPPPGSPIGAPAPDGCSLAG